MNTPLNTPNGTTFNCINFIVLTNRYGHPHKETLERLKEIGSRILRTDELGAIILTISPSGEVKPEGYGR